MFQRGPKYRVVSREAVRANICSYTVNGKRCPHPRTSLSKDGQFLPSPYCRQHCCRRVVMGAACTRLGYGGRDFCQEHLRCTSNSHGQRCLGWVKGLDPAATNLCQDHCCSANDCGKERVHDRDVDLKYCPDHRCLQEACNKIKAAGSNYCVVHTCEAPNCLVWVPGGDPGEVSRYCERHRICQHGDCNRFTFTRENGQGCLHCGAHYCHFADCDKPRDRLGGGDYCQAHTCREEGCSKGKAKEDGYFCKNHECARRECRYRAWLGEWCPQHQCARPGCPDEAVANHYCNRHLVCPVERCGHFRMLDGDNVRDRCEEHFHARCQKRHCSSRTLEGRQWCQDHVCRMRTCGGERLQGFQYCRAHKCSEAACPELKGLARGAGYGWAMNDDDEDAPRGRFCGGHACQWEGGCEQGQVARTLFCEQHQRCQHQGCANLADRGAQDPTRCREHRRAAPRDHEEPDLGTIFGRLPPPAPPWEYGWDWWRRRGPRWNGRWH